MKIAIMQPYLFPYIGYFQLLKIVDIFVIYDDVNFIKKGWINRNNILLNGESKMITLGLKGASQNKMIKDIEIGDEKQKLLETIRHAYSKAPYFDTVFPLIKRLFNTNIQNLADFIIESLVEICDYLEIEFSWVKSSTIEKPQSILSQDKLIYIAKKLNCDEYYNLPGGKTLYNAIDFSNAGIDLKFIEPEFIKYRQFDNKFIAGLSIIDILMFNNITDIHLMLDKVTIVSA